MTSLHLHVQARAAMDVPWDREREKRVLHRALDARRGRARRRLAFELTAALVLTFIAGRILPRASAGSADARPAPAATLPAPDANPTDAVATPPSQSASKQTKSRSLGGFAGTGGHGGSGSTGHGGSAGTG